jgi:hypothetical protein
MIRVMIDFDPTSNGLTISAAVADQPAMVVPHPVVFAVVNAAFIEMLSQKIKAEIAGAPRIVPVDGAALNRLQRPNLG